MDDINATAALDALVQRALGDDAVSADEAGQLEAACLCGMAQAADGPWLSRLLAGEPNSVEPKPTREAYAGSLAAFVTLAITRRTVRGAEELAELIMFDHDLADHPALAGMVRITYGEAPSWSRVSWAWRRIWRDINENHLEPVGHCRCSISSSVR